MLGHNMIVRTIEKYKQNYYSCSPDIQSAFDLFGSAVTSTSTILGFRKKTWVVIVKQPISEEASYGYLTTNIIYIIIYIGDQL